MRTLVASALALAVANIASAEEPVGPPNIVVLLVDDLGATDLGCFGSTFYETPNVDRLASGGVRFMCAYAACPVCSPTRASILTGRYPQRVGVTDYINARGANQPGNWRRNTRLLPAPYQDHLPREETTIADALGEAGYATFFAGKWHLGGDDFLPTAQGFDRNQGGYHAGSPRSYFSPYQNPKLSDGPAGEHLPLRLANETCRFVEANADRPFFAYLSFYSVHTPLATTDALREKYEAKAAALDDAKVWSRERESALRLVHSHPTYAGMVEAMDRAVGIVLDKLDQLEIADNTLVLFTSDNGGLATGKASPTSNAPLRAGKGWLYEGGIRVPTILRWPGRIDAGTTCNTPVISNDYFPTLLEASGEQLEPSFRFDGHSLLPLVRGEVFPQRALYWDYPHYGNQGGMPGAAIRVGRWKLIHWYEDRSNELYDLNADPSEQRNVADSHPDVTERLLAELFQWRASVGARSPSPNPNFESQQ